MRCVVEPVWLFDIGMDVSGQLSTTGLQETGAAGTRHDFKQPAKEIATGRSLLRGRRCAKEIGSMNSVAESQ